MGGRYRTLGLDVGPRKRHQDQLFLIPARAPLAPNNLAVRGPTPAARLRPGSRHNDSGRSLYLRAGRREVLGRKETVARTTGGRQELAAERPLFNRPGT